MSKLFSVFVVMFVLPLSAEPEVKITSLEKRYDVIKNSMMNKDFSERENVVFGIRCYYNLCGVNQMVSVFASTSGSAPDDLIYSIEVASSNIAGSANPSVIVNRWKVDFVKLKQLLEYSNEGELFKQPRLVEEKDKTSGQLIFAERWSKDGKENVVIIRDFYESREIDELMLKMYQLAWNPMMW